MIHHGDYIKKLTNMYTINQYILVYIMWIIVSPVNTSSVRVEYNSGNIIRPLDKTLNAGHTKLDILLKVPDIQPALNNLVTTEIL